MLYYIKYGVKLMEVIFVKRILCFCTTVLLVFSMLGCNATNPPIEDKTDSTTENSQRINKDTTASEAEPQIKYSELIPDPQDYFPNGEISVILPDTGTTYLFQVRNYETTEYDAYVAACKELGFTNISYEFETTGGKMFGAYTEDDAYWVEVMMGYNNNIIAVTCQPSKQAAE